MEDKREQCEKCTMNCPPNIIQAKINKGRIPFDKCMDFSPKQTNADRIRSMTDEELAEFLEGINKGYDISYGDYISMNEGIFISDRKDLSKEILKWLQSKAE